MRKIYLKAAAISHGSNASWIDSTVAALAVDLEEYTGKPVAVSGPYGLRAEVMLKVGEGYTTITPSFQDGVL